MANEREVLTWPPKVGTRICLDTGHEHNSWSAEVRAIVDDDYAVLKRWRSHKGWHTYEIIDRLEVETFNGEHRRGTGRAMFYVGALPKRTKAHATRGE